MFKKILLYVIAFSIPLALGVTAWQSARYSALRSAVERNTRLQTEIIEQNRRLIIEITALSASSRIERLARDSLGLEIKRPEDTLHISIRQ